MNRLNAEYAKKHNLRTFGGGHVAVVTLWRDPDKAVDMLHDAGLVGPCRLSDGTQFDNGYPVAVVGTLYTLRGINQLLRGLWLNPCLRQLVTWGPDTQKTGKALERLWFSGPECRRGEWYIPGTEVKIDPMIPIERVEHLVKHVTLTLVDKSTPAEGLAAHLLEPTMKNTAPHGVPEAFPENTTVASGPLPAAPMGMHLRAATTDQLWQDALQAVTRFGTDKGADLGTGQRELLGLSLTLDGVEDPTAVRISHAATEALGVTQEGLDAYAEDSFFTVGVPPAGVHYTPGNRLMVYHGVDQINDMVSEINRSSDTRRAVGVLWDPPTDGRGNPYPPCITQVQAHVVGSELHMTATLRSSDVLKALFADVVGLRRLQLYLCEEPARQDLRLGALTLMIGSAHVYAEDLPLATEVVGWRRPASQMPEFDPQGNIVVEVGAPDDDGTFEVIVVGLHPTTQEAIWNRSGKWLEVTRTIADERLISEPFHWAYLGREVYRAAHEGPAYVQDKG